MILKKPAAPVFTVLTGSGWGAVEAMANGRGEIYQSDELLSASQEGHLHDVRFVCQRANHFGFLPSCC